MYSQRVAFTALVTVFLTTLTCLTDRFSTADPTALALVSTPNNPTTADQLFQQALEHYQAGRFEAALKLWQQTLTIYQKLQDRQGEAAALGALGSVYLALENYNQAVVSSQAFLSIAQTMGDRRSQAQALGNLGIAYKATGNYAKAIASYQQALTVMRQVRDRQAEGQLLGNLGNVYEALGDYDRAITSYQQSLAIAQETKDRPGEGLVLGTLGAVYANLGDYDQAILSYQQSLAIAQSLGDPHSEGNTLNNLGSSYHAQRNYSKAIEYYRQSLAIARETSSPRLEGEVLGNLGLAYEDLRDHPKAIQQLEHSLGIVQKLGDPRAKALALKNLGYALFKSGKLAAAEKNIRASLKIQDTLRLNLSDVNKISIFDTQSSGYNLLQKVLVVQKKLDAALEASEWRRSRAFVDLLSTRLSATTEVERQEAISRVSTPPPTIGQIRQIARTQNATLIEYSIIPESEFKFQGKLRGQESELFIWVVQPQGQITFRRVDLKFLREQQSTSLVNLARSQGIAATGRGVDPTPLTQLIRDTQESVRVRGGSADIETVAEPTARNRRRHKKLQQLYQLLIQPIADLLPNNPNARIIFIPQESLFFVPFPALQDNSRQYLVEQHTLLTAPSIQVLALTHQQQQRVQAFPGNRALVVGNPTMPILPGNPPHQLPQLPGAEQEAIAIARLLHTQAITGKQATKAAVVRADARMPS